MTPQSSSSAAAVMRLKFTRPDVADVAAVRLFEDAAGGGWVRTYNPSSPDTANTLRSMGELGEIHLEIEPLPPDDFRAAEMAWLQANRQSLTDLYPGEWLAIDGTELIAHGGDLAELLKRCREAGHPNPFVTAVPTEPNIRVHL